MTESSEAHAAGGPEATPTSPTGDGAGAGAGIGVVGGLLGVVAIILLVVAVVGVNSHPGLDINGVTVRCDAVTDDAAGGPGIGTTGAGRPTVGEGSLFESGSPLETGVAQYAVNDCAHQRSEKLGHAVEELAAAVLLGGIGLAGLAWGLRGPRRRVRT